ncbi:MAG: hypothetical protein CMJ25_02860 [Phycisphaerae bacterium]|nr:hypothetical protein [Phycisphaerae bacterium]|tara:strand:- start:371 stop:787 length:417 start_codon:yes stop_codon:yes gene_type:complete
MKNFKHFFTFFIMQYLQLTTKQVEFLQDQIKEGYYSGEQLQMANLLIDEDISGLTKGAIALVYNHLVPRDEDSRYNPLSQWDAFQVEIIEIPGMTFAITKMSLEKLQRHLDDYAQGLLTKQEIFKKALESGGALVKFG